MISTERVGGGGERDTQNSSFNDKLSRCSMQKLPRPSGMGGGGGRGRGEVEEGDGRGWHTVHQCPLIVRNDPIVQYLH